MKTALDFLRELSVSSWCGLIVILCFTAIMIILVIVSDKVEKDFNKWLLENATETDEGHYLYRHDKSGRFYSRSELKDFFINKKDK